MIPILIPHPKAIFNVINRALGKGWIEISENEIPKWAKKRLIQKYSSTPGGQPGCWLVRVKGKHYRYSLREEQVGFQEFKLHFYKYKRKERNS